MFEAVPSIARRALLAAAALLALPATAQNTPIKFQLDWRFEARPRSSSRPMPRATTRPRA